MGRHAPIRGASPCAAPPRRRVSPRLAVCTPGTAVPNEHLTAVNCPVSLICTFVPQMAACGPDAMPWIFHRLALHISTAVGAMLTTSDRFTDDFRSAGVTGFGTRPVASCDDRRTKVPTEFLSHRCSRTASFGRRGTSFHFGFRFPEQARLGEPTSFIVVQRN